MQFRLSTLLWFFLVVASVLGAFGAWGLLVLAFLLVYASIAATRRGRLSIVILAACLAFAYSLVVHSHREGYRMSSCRQNLKSLGLALHNYHDAYKCFPPPYVADNQGRPLYSWRVLLLPYLYEKPLYSQFHLDEPWDSPHNRALPMPYAFQCPETHGSGALPPDVTAYVAVTGPGTAWPGDHPTTIRDFRDGTSETAMVVETNKTNIHWAEPRDLSLEEALSGRNGSPSVPSSNHSTGRVYFWYRDQHALGHIMMADGSVRCVWKRSSREELAALLSIAGGESVDLDQIAPRTAPWSRFDLARVIGCPLFLVSFIILVTRRPTESSATTNEEGLTP